MTLITSVWEVWWHLQLNILVAINSVVHVPGISIIVFTIFIRLLTVPLTMKSLKSNRNMQAIQPLIKELQKKYAKDRQKQQEETMKIYQQYGINPAAGCFPMLVQLPIFFALYSALQFTLQHGTNKEMLEGVLYFKQMVPWANFSQPFLWIQNLAKPDPYYIWPVLSGVFQFIQSRMAMPLREPGTPVDPQTKMMNNMMQFMPIYIVLISLGFPSGTVVYWAMSNVVGAAQQYFITGWGSLPNVPGFGFLPRKTYTPPSIDSLPAPSPDRPVKKGFMGRLMDKAVEAQEQAKSQQQLTAGSRETIAATGTNGRRSTRAPRKGSQAAVRVVTSETAKYASDIKHRPAAEGASDRSNGAITTISTPQLPRKRKGKR